MGRNKTRKFTKVSQVPEGESFFHTKANRVFVKGPRIPQQQVYICTHAIGTGTAHLGGNAEVLVGHEAISAALVEVLNGATADFIGYFGSTLGKRGILCGEKIITTEFTVEEVK